MGIFCCYGVIILLLESDRDQLNWPVQFKVIAGFEKNEIAILYNKIFEFTSKCKSLTNFSALLIGDSNNIFLVCHLLLEWFGILIFFKILGTGFFLPCSFVRQVIDQIIVF